MEVNLVADFISETGASESDAISCLQTWGWDLKKALIDYNGTKTIAICFLNSLFLAS
jgi:UBA-like domain